ncbi:MAG: molecular chaperone HtpG [Oscillospiraceae bacterium]|jgi:molecular chaperone HtpG|nr:molecular chaperone HtpG [Oscillospiraceae bacterium]
MAKKQFKTESKRVLELMINSIYTHPEIFLREIISNASDAIDKLCYLSLTDERVGLQRADFRIKIGVSEETRMISVSDNGIGMTREELESNLGVIARSGSLKFRNEMEKSGEASDLDIIGQFGVGFYSAFMVSDRVTVITRAYGSDTAYKWESAGTDGYTIEEWQKDGVGTDVIMRIKPDAEESEYTRFLNDMSIGQLVKKYSDFIRWPIVIDAVEAEEVETGETDADGKPVMKQISKTVERTINSRVPIWQRPKDEVSQEESDEFYQNIYYDYEPPAETIRVSAEGQVAYQALLFIPGRAPANFFSDLFEPGLQLYSNGVMIMERCKEVIPGCFRFVRGVVDSPDFPLNISRETLQSGRQLRIIQTNIEKKVKNALRRLMDEEPEKYEKFYAAFGLHLKYGVVENYGEKKDLLTDLLMFYSSKEKKPVSLRAYKEKMLPEQKRVYYVCTDSIASAESLPQAEQIREKGYEILYMTDDVDDFIVRRLESYEDVKFCNITNDDLGLETEEEKAEAEKQQAQYRTLLDFIKETLGEGVADVRLSRKLKSHPVYLTSEGEISIEMEKYFALMKGDMSQKIKARRVLELNASHAAFKSLEQAFETDKDRAEKLAKILHSQALLIAGLPLENPAEYTELICGLF